MNSSSLNARSTAHSAATVAPHLAVGEGSLLSTEEVDPQDAEGSASESATTDQESSAALQDPSGPSLRARLAQKLLRDKRLGDIPGWFDRWDFFSGAISLEHSIACVQPDNEQAALRRRLWGKVTYHLALLASLMAICVYIPVLTSILDSHFTSGACRVALYLSLLLEIVFLKLALDKSILRRLLYSIYIVTLAILLVSSQIAFAHPSVFYCTQLTVLSSFIILLMCGVQRTSGEGHPVFLGHLAVGSVASAVAIAVASVLHISLDKTTLFIDDDHFTLAVLALIVMSFAGAYEAELLARTLTRDETWLAIYCVHFDFYVVTLVMPTIAAMIFAGGVLGLAVGVPVEFLRQAFANAYSFARDGSTFSLVWNLKGWCWQSSSVGVEPRQEE